jgi:hypothetical protein
MLQHGRDSDSLMTCWTDANGKPNLSIVDMQRFRNEIHAQSYHLRANSGLVLRTQSLVQLPDQSSKETPSSSARRR